MLKPPKALPRTEDLDKAVEGFDPKAAKKAESIPAPKSALEVHTTIPLDKSLEALKARRKSKKVKKGNKENEQIKSDGDGSRRADPSDSGQSGSRGWGIVLPLDYYRKAGKD